MTIRQRIELPSQPWFTARVATPAASLLLLPHFADPATVERCLDHCLAHRLTSVPRIQELIDQVAPRAVIGRRLLVELLDQRSSGMGHRSRLEQRVAGWLAGAGLSGWERNHRVVVGPDTTVEVDFAWPNERVALEVSPFFTHGSRATQERDAERRRQLMLEGWRIVEATDPDLANARAFTGSIRTLRAVLADAASTSRALGSSGGSPTPTTSGGHGDELVA